MMTLDKLIQNIPVISIEGRTDIAIRGISFDSRQVEKGYLFAACTGTSVDGHNYIKSAIEKGAVAIVCEHSEGICTDDATIIRVESSDYALGLIASRWYGEPSKHLCLVGVTGTNGKTTIATLLYRLTQEAGHKAGLLSTVCNYVDHEPVAATHTTPDAIALNALLARMVEAGCEFAFMEVSSHSVVQNRIAGLDFDGGVFTNLTRDHIDFHKTFDNYRDAKKAFFDHLKKGSFAVTNKDDKNGLVMTQNTQAEVHTYSTRTIADYKAQILEEGFDGMLLNINGQEVHIPLVGRFNTSNILAIYGAALCLGFEKDEVLRILSTLKAVNGRFETI